MNRITLFLFAYVLMYSSIFTPKGFVKEKIWQKPLRGVTVQLSLKEDDLRFLAEEWKSRFCPPDAHERRYPES